MPFLRRVLLAALFAGMRCGAFAALPHLHGAPLPYSETEIVPPFLARQFVVAATVASFLFWAVLGAATGYFYQCLGRRAA